MKQLTRYAIVGISSNLAGYSAYLLLTFLNVGPKLAMTLVYLTGAVVSFIGNLCWTFKNKGKFLSAALKYAIVHICGYSLNFFILYIFVDWMFYPHQAVQAVSIGIVSVFLYCMLKRVVFSNPVQVPTSVFK